MSQRITAMQRENPPCHSALGWIVAWTLILACVPLTAQGADAARKGKSPNILLLLADDLSYQAVGALGNTEVETPNIDRIAARGAIFPHCYNMGGWNGAICIASRTMLNTGRFLWKAPQKRADLETLAEQQMFWSQQLATVGYRTWMTGKWHVSVDPAQVFDEVRHVRGGMPKDTSSAYNRPLDGQPDPWSPFDRSQGGYWEGGRHWSVVTADDAVNYLKESTKLDQPSFFYVAFNAPHDPRQSPEEFVKRYPVGDVAVPENFLPEYPHRVGIGLNNLRDENLAPLPRTPRSVQTHRAEYYAIIAHLDAQIGRILDTLETLDSDRDTWIIFTADHGLSVGHHGLIGKQNMYEHSMRVPMMIVGPGVTAGERIETPIYMQDIMPTVLEIAGVQPNASVDFRSLLPALTQSGSLPDRPIYGAYIDWQRMIVDDGLKLILYPKIGVARMFNLNDDPLEKNDLLSGTVSEASRRRAKELFKKLLDLQQVTGDSLELSASFPTFSPG